MTLPEAYKSQVQHIQSSPKFQRLPEGAFQPVPFPGYTVITPPWVEETQNDEFYQRLQTFQQQMLQQLAPGLVAPVPPESFHLTLADLIWDSTYRHAKEENPAFEEQLRDRIAQSFQQCQSTVKAEAPIYWQVLGVVVMTRAIGVCLAPKDESSYERILQLRRAIYQNQDLMAVGIEQQYHFTAHITLGYFNDVAASDDRDALGDALTDLTEHWLEGSPQALWIHRAELRKFDDMARYYREQDWAVVEF
jgi:hypothetical protein